ncbi:MAG: thioredoxin domain-containing protein [Rhodospirillaceae bacterium]|jgi:uncharacterized protein|nr:thioredoxin domain-containing protein [Rhodospirillaceae bacterium]MBT4220179.1 thioredoxin domain-containing protein [Rhodospirillaceae bacterium]MBT4464923.1 thioredoxin domain-containing protein [Rhodospirillaceae bacterium]MBT5013696.1 thioredoxin domain-containing protein [Rhodospirillaceae bacterium]MBT5308478.1 thioredoxin domain-containing protein [Rhodospirillaceae bacterium]
MNTNQLVRETSPYLLQHQDNPVHWWAWGEEALEHARTENKPILLSIGYSACHWCHVMAHESFEDEAIAGVMNEHFVNIKVDREERPDLDVIYQSALALMGEQGGWPLTMFLTPEGEPFWGGTYFPATPRYGRPAFPELLKHVSQTYIEDHDKVRDSVKSMLDALNQLSKPAGGGGLSFSLLNEASSLSLHLIDTVEGGLSGAPKFPQVSYFKSLWRAYLRTGKQDFLEVITLTLDKMCQGGIYDHVGGGFARYSTDDIWLAPHFEKMLYDNAQLIDLLTEVWRHTNSPLYGERVSETIDWALREMVVGKSGDDDGGFAFASALDADSEGVEGKFYVWGEAEIDTALGNDAIAFKAAYDVRPNGNWHEGGEGVNILNRNANPDATFDENLMAACRIKLLSIREGRIRPGRDDKALCDWNAMMVAALAHAGQVFGRDDWIKAARDVFHFICANMIEDGRLRHSWRDGSLRHAAVLDDYAHMIRAAIMLTEATGEVLYLEQATSWLAVVNARYWDEAGAGYYLTADDAPGLITRSKTIADNAVPSANGVMTEALARMYLLTGDEAHRERAEKLIRVFSSSSARNLTNLPGLMAAYEVLENAAQIVIVGRPDDDATAALLDAAISAAPPWAVLLRIAPGEELPAGHPAVGKTGVDVPTAFGCAAGTCGLPIIDDQSLRKALHRE